MLQKILAAIRTTSEIDWVKSNSPKNPCHPLNILSANLLHPWPHFHQGIDRLHQFIQLVQDLRADILILQEVWQTQRHKAHEILAQKLAMNAIYTRTNGDQQYIGFEEGLAILSRYPLLPFGKQVFRSSLYPFARRQALGVNVQTPCGDLLAISAHLSINPWRNHRQIQQLIHWVENQPNPAIIGGDFNAAESTSRIRYLKNRWLDTLRHIHPTHPDPATHRVSVPLLGEFRHRLDYLFVYQKDKIWKVLNAGKDGRCPFSDHDAVWTQLALSG